MRLDRQKKMIWPMAFTIKSLTDGNGLAAHHLSVGASSKARARHELAKLFQTIVFLFTEWIKIYNLCIVDKF